MYMVCGESSSVQNKGVEDSDIQQIETVKRYTYTYIYVCIPAGFEN